MSSENPSPQNYSDSEDEVDLEDAVVREDPELLPEEKQFTIVGSKADDRLTVYAEVGAVVRALLTNSETKLTRTRRVDGDIVAVEATIPRSLLSVKAVERSGESWHEVVSGGGDE